MCYLLIKKKIKKPEPEYRSISFEERFKVIEIIDGDTFKISPGWKWNNRRGDIIRPAGYDTPERGDPGYQESKEKLKAKLSDSAKMKAVILDIITRNNAPIKRKELLRQVKLEKPIEVIRDNFTDRKMRRLVMELIADGHAISSSEKG